MDRLSVVCILFLITSGCHSSDDDSWLYGNWISDLETTRSQNPHFEDLPENVRNDYLSMFGTLRWRVSEQNLTAIDELGTEVTAEITVNGEELELVDLASGLRSQFFLRPTDSGFCVKLASMDVRGIPDIEVATYSRDSKFSPIECYRAHGSSP